MLTKMKVRGPLWFLVVGLIWGCLILTGASFYRTFTLAKENERAVARILVVEAEVQEIIQQSFLDCPNRAKARMVIRTALLRDPDLTADTRTLIETNFKEITCTP